MDIDYMLEEGDCVDADEIPWERIDLQDPTLDSIYQARCAIHKKLLDHISQIISGNTAMNADEQDLSLKMLRSALIESAMEKDRLERCIAMRSAVHGY